MFSHSSKLSFVALLIVTLACNGLTKTTPISETPQISTTPVSTLQPTSTVDDFKIAEGGEVSFQYPTNLIQGVDVVQVPAEIDSPTPHPSYTEFTLKGYPINSDTTPAQISIYPIKEFVNLVPSIADDLKALKELKSYETNKAIPFPLIINANPLFDVRRSWTFLPGGISGFLFLTQFGQDISPITNEGLTYVFIGQSENGLLIVAFFPVNASGLPTSFNDVNSNEWQNNFPEYIKGVNQHLLSLQPNDFTPHLDVLDKIIYSIAVQASNNPSSGLVFGSIEETQKAQDQKVETLTKVADEQYSSEFLVGETRNYTIHATNSDRHLRWYQGWCAKSDNILAQNLKNMKFDLQVNGQTIDLDKKALANYFKDSDGLSCFSYSIVMYGWSSGSTLLTSKLIFLNTINDGISDYKAGEMTKIYTVINP